MATRRIEASRRIAEETRRLYEPLLAKPLDERQLLRPSFKFIQELVKSLMIETKLLRDVFNANHFNATDKSAQDKRAKLEFIQKLIDFAANNRQPVANCLATKVLAGLEPNKTNELLQSLARIAQSRASDRDERRPRTFTRSSRPTDSAGSRRRSDSSSARASSGAARAPGAGRQAAPVAATPVAAPVKQEPSPNEVQPAAEAKVAQEVRRVSSSTSSQPPADERRKLSSGGAAGAKVVVPQAAQQQTTTTTKSKATSVESGDLLRGTALVRTNLRALKETLANIAKLEDSLRASLATIRDGNEASLETKVVL